MEFSEHSRVWIYQSDRQLTANEESRLQQLLTEFTAVWTAHNHQLRARAEIRYHRFIILIVDERQAGASGCSIDKSVNFLKLVEKEFGIGLFDRFNLAYRKGSEVHSAARDEFEAMLRSGVITGDSIVFNNLVKTLGELETDWEIPFRRSWHARYFSDLITN